MNSLAQGAAGGGRGLLGGVPRVDRYFLEVLGSGFKRIAQDGKCVGLDFAGFRGHACSVGQVRGANKESSVTKRRHYPF
jgi:hypothetical protein